MTTATNRNAVIEVELKLGENVYQGKRGAPRAIAGTGIRQGKFILLLAVDQSVPAPDCEIDLTLVGQVSTLPYVCSFKGQARPGPFVHTRCIGEMVEE